MRDGENHWLRRGIADFAIALSLFWAVALFVNGDHSRAHAVGVPRIGQDTILKAAITSPASWYGPADSRPGRRARDDIDQRQAMVLLSVAFAAIIALNLAFWRHLRRVYASPRRSVWRRGR